jgi:hypothetical protein
MIPEQVSQRSIELLEKRGYVIWKCHELNDECITIVTSRLNGCPKKYPVYTVKELRILCENKNPKLIHEAVKLGGTIEDTELV